MVGLSEHFWNLLQNWCLVSNFEPHRFVTRKIFCVQLIKPRIDEELRLETTLENYGSHVAKAKMGQDKDIISSP